MSRIDITKNKDLIITQFQKEPIIQDIINGLDSIIQKNHIDILCNLESSLSIDNAYGYFLDRLGNNFGYPRPSIPQNYFNYFGFNDSGSNFDNAPFYYGVVDPLTPVGDIIYKKLLKLWIKNIFYDGSFLDANKALILSLGKSYLINHYNLSASVVIYDEPAEIVYAIIKQDLVPQVAGIRYNEYSVKETGKKYFGFAGCIDAVGFNQAPFAKTIYKDDII
jgi:hypothetical protein